MKKLFIFFALTLLLISTTYSQNDATVDSVADHNSWGWTSIVQTNNIITIATVPAIGARIMQYDLGSHAFMYVNPSDIGKTYPPVAGGLHSYGGYVVWPGPQARWNWPPPPVLDYGQYDANIVLDSPDSTSVFVSSDVEKWQAPDLRFERQMTIYKGTSRVRVDQIIINVGSNQQSWSIWDVTQTIAKAPQDNYWVYFPINPNSEHGDEAVYFRYNTKSQAWKGEVAPGIYGVVFRPEGNKLFSDPDKGWIAYVDEGAGKAYIKTFKVFEGATYPGDKGGGRVQVYLGTFNFEVEVASPIVDLEANGGRYSFTQNWYAATMNGPILAVNEAGAIQLALSQDSDTGNIQGLYGVFYIGTAKLIAKDQSDAVLVEGISNDITPLELLIIDEAFQIPENTAKIDLVAYNAAGEEIGILDSTTPGILSSVSTNKQTIPVRIQLFTNFPNPFNPQTTISYQLSRHSDVVLNIYNVNGQLIQTLVNEKQSAGSYLVLFDGTDVASGIYLCNLQAGNTSVTQRMLLMK